MKKYRAKWFWGGAALLIAGLAGADLMRRIAEPYTEGVRPSAGREMMEIYKRSQGRFDRLTPADRARLEVLRRQEGLGPIPEHQPEGDALPVKAAGPAGNAPPEIRVP